MKGYVAVTDPGWYEHLAQEPGLALPRFLGQLR